MENLYKKWPLSLFREDDNKTSSKPLKTTTTTTTTNNDQHTNNDNDNTDVVIIIVLIGPRLPGELFRLFLSSKIILTSYDLLCCSVGARVDLRGREDVNANVCGVADQAGGGTVSAGIFVCFFHHSKNTHFCYYQCRERRPWGRAGRVASGKGT